MLSTAQMQWSMPDSLRPVPAGDERWAASDPVTEAAITGAALVRHLDDFRFASLRALRQIHRALGAERVAIGFIDAEGMSVREALAWSGGFGRCGDSERVVSCEAFAAKMGAWMASRSGALEVGIDGFDPAWHELGCDRLLLVRGERFVKGLGQAVLLAQLRAPAPLAGGADHALAMLLDEYACRRQSVRA